MAVTNMDMDSSLMQLIRNGLRNLYLEDGLTDVTLVVEDIELRCHRVVLAAASPYFRAMFLNSGFKERKQQAVHLEGVSHNALRNLLGFLYGVEQSLLSNTDGDEAVNIMELLMAANMLQIQPLLVHCLQQLSSSLTLHLQEPLFLVTLFDVLNNLDVENCGLVNIVQPKCVLHHIGVHFKNVAASLLLEHVPWNTLCKVFAFPGLAASEDIVLRVFIGWLDCHVTGHVSDSHISELLGLMVIGDLSESSFQTLLAHPQITEQIRGHLLARREEDTISRDTVARRLVLTRFSESHSFHLNRVDTESLTEDSLLPESTTLPPPPLPSNVTNGRMLSAWTKGDGPDSCSTNTLYYVAVVDEHVIHIFMFDQHFGWEEIGSLAESCSESLDDELTEHRLRIYSVCAFQARIYILLELRDAQSGSKVAAKLISAEAVSSTDVPSGDMPACVKWRDFGHLFHNEYGRMGMSRQRRCFFYNPVMTAADKNHLFFFDVGDNYHLQIPDCDQVPSSPTNRMSRRTPMLVLISLETTRPISLSEEIPLTSAALGPAVVLANKRRLPNAEDTPALALFVPDNRMTSGVWHTIQLDNLLTSNDMTDSAFRVILLSDDLNLYVAILTQDTGSEGACWCTLSTIEEVSDFENSSYRVVPQWTRRLDVGFMELEFVNAYIANLNLWQLNQHQTKRSSV